MKRASRIITKNNYIIITNLKCGYSSINQLDNISLPKKIDKDIIFIYRNIYNRNISVFLHWCLRYKDNIINSWLLKLMKLVLKEDFDKFINLLNNNLIEAYKIFISNLHIIYKTNPHLHPQYAILNKFKVKNIKYFINLDKEEDCLLFNNLINDNLGLYCKSSKDNSELLLNFLNTNQDYKNKINKIYYKDINFFKLHNIN